jgi:hypothetical protein
MKSLPVIGQNCLIAFKRKRAQRGKLGKLINYLPFPLPKKLITSVNEGFDKYVLYHLFVH